VFPERVLFEFYGKLLGDQATFVVKELTDCSLDADDVFAEYPVLIYKDKLIRKQHIGTFL
jgi:hypothetical protein